MRRTLLLPLFAFSALIVGGETTDDKVKMTGCLTKTADGEYMLTNHDGKKMIVTGGIDLEKHASNHKVTLHGTEKTTEGKTILQVIKVDHVSNSCEAPANQ